MKDHSYDKRRYVMSGVVLLILTIFTLQLFSLQADNDSYRDKANSNAFYEKTIYPARGLMYDRNGKLLVYNKPSYDIMFVPRELKGVDTLELCDMLGITVEDFKERVKRVKNRALNPGYSPYTEQELMTQLTAEEYALFQEKLFQYPGLHVRKRSIRKYNYAAAGVLLGDIGEVSQKKIDKDPYYQRGDYIGTQGIEASYEEVLRGRKGTEVLLRDARGRIQGSYRNGEFDTIAERGKDLTLSIDIELQELGERLMKNKLGSIVAIEPSTGEILCMVSSPSYDPSLLTGRDRGKNHKELTKDKRKPLMNRAIMGQYPPGSTFKTSQAATFMQEGIIDNNTAFPCSGGFVMGKFRLGCHAHAAPITLKPAIATSCNAYFCWGLNRMFNSNKYPGGTKAATSLE